MHPRTNEVFIINATNEVLLSYFLKAYCVIDPEEKRAGKMHTIILKNNDTELIINHKKIFVKKIDEAILLINRYIRNRRGAYSLRMFYIQHIRFQCSFDLHERGGLHGMPRRESMGILQLQRWDCGQPGI